MHQEQEISARLEVEQLHENRKVLLADQAKEKKQYEAELAAASTRHKELENIVKELKGDLIVAEAREKNSKRELNKVLEVRSTVIEDLKVFINLFCIMTVNRLQANLDYVTSDDNSTKLVERARSLQKQLDASRKFQVVKDITIADLEQELERRKSDQSLEEQLTFISIPTVLG
ncbi:hypothetical protein R1flu_025708 [Riccia fluitans]|uniref:Uncharacterized protein n=1 Tax=Riccia fluitans TaxID=41844 RepID=A0ABD1XYI4_9MARC